MPLSKSSDKKAIGQNIKKLRSENYPQKQAVAIALSIQRKAKGKPKPKKKGY